MTSLDTHPETRLGDYIALLKPSVMSLAVFTAMIGMFVAPVPVHPVIGFASVLFIAVGAGASGALNMWYDADIDGLMTRTRSRPIPAGRVAAGDALMLGLWLSGLSIVMLALTANLLAGALLALSIAFYIAVYTMVLKRRTVQNIVIGGAAGALPPVIGWAVATGGVAWEPFLMFLLIFLWTPPHFWALALYAAADYRQAAVPMMTVAHGERVTRRQILIYCLALLPVSLLVVFSPIGGPATAAVALAVNGVMVAGAIRLVHRAAREAESDSYAAERLFFRQTLFYLFALFSAMAVDAMLRAHLMANLNWPVLF
ncbi:MAG: heme o synthase [Rhodobacteraceae bacterium]|nr:heme o synthase [Paracoccaceae bacterium]